MPEDYQSAARYESKYKVDSCDKQELGVELLIVSLGVVTGKNRYKHVGCLTEKLGNIVHEPKSDGVVGDTCS